MLGTTTVDSTTADMRREVRIDEMSLGLPCIDKQGIQFHSNGRHQMAGYRDLLLCFRNGSTHLHHYYFHGPNLTPDSVITKLQPQVSS